MHNASFNEERLSLLLNTHPNVFSINNITDAFDELAIPNAVIQIEPTELQKLPLPFLSVVVINNQSSFVIVKSITNESVNLIGEGLEVIVIDKETFIQSWQNVAIVVEVEVKNTFFSTLNLTKNWANYLFLVLLFLGISIFNNSLNSFIYSLFSLTGLVISYIIFLTENGNTTVSNKFCGGSSTINCHAVLNSKGSKIFGKFKLSDACMLYFTILIIYSFFPNQDTLNATMIFSFAALCIIPFSIYYQWQIVKKWCTLCLAIVTILLLQFAVIVPFYKNLLLLNFVQFIGISALVSLFALVIWFGYKKQFVQLQKLKIAEFEALKFKRDDILFLAAWQALPFIKTNFFASPVYYGNPSAALKIIVVANPFCEPCANTHVEMNKVFAKIPDNVFIQYSFFFNENDAKDERAIAAKNITKNCLVANDTEEKKEILDNWFKTRQLQHLKSEVLVEQSEKAMQAYTQLTAANNIAITPTIIVNNKVLPMVYTPDCLPWILPYLTNTLTHTNS
jgi:uncharacterized membrane protein